MTESRQLAHDEYLRSHEGVGIGAQWTPRPLRGYRRAWLRDDLVAGVTVAALVIPLGLAFAQLAGLPAVYGLYTSVLPVLLFALVASTPQAVVGAEAALSGIVAAAIMPAVADGHDRVEAAAALALMIGLFCILGAGLRAGRLAQVVSRTVFVGYLAGVAMSVSIGQLPRLLGAPAYEHDTVLRQLVELPGVLSSTVPAAAAIGLTTLLVVLVGRRLAPRLPIALVALAAAATLVRMLDLDAHDVALIGALPSGIPQFVVPSLHVADLLRMAPAAAAIALVGFADTTLVSQGFAARNGYAVDSTRDLAALGAADLASGTFGGLPVSASSARTAAAEATGAHSQVASIVSALAIAATLLVGGDLVRSIPQPALAGIIIAVMLGIVDRPAIAVLAAGRRSELAICIVAFLGVATLGVLQGVAVAVVMSVAVIVVRAARPHDSFLGLRPDMPGLVPLDEHESARPAPGFLVYRMDAPLFFGNADRLRDRLVGAVSDPANDGVRHVIVAASAITDIDYTAGQVLEEVAARLAAANIELTVAGINHELARELLASQPSDSRVRYTTAGPDTLVTGANTRKPPP